MQNSKSKSVDSQQKKSKKLNNNGNKRVWSTSSKCLPSSAKVDETDEIKFALVSYTRYNNEHQKQTDVVSINRVEGLSKESNFAYHEDSEYLIYEDETEEIVWPAQIIRLGSSEQELLKWKNEKRLVVKPVLNKVEWPAAAKQDLNSAADTPKCVGGITHGEKQKNVKLAIKKTNKSIVASQELNIHRIVSRVTKRQGLLIDQEDTDEDEKPLSQITGNKIPKFSKSVSVVDSSYSNKIPNADGNDIHDTCTKRILLLEKINDQMSRTNEGLLLAVKVLEAEKIGLKDQLAALEQKQERGTTKTADLQQSGLLSSIRNVAASSVGIFMEEDDHFSTTVNIEEPIGRPFIAVEDDHLFEASDSYSGGTTPDERDDSEDRELHQDFSDKDTIAKKILESDFRDWGMRFKALGEAYKVESTQLLTLKAGKVYVGWSQWVNFDAWQHWKKVSHDKSPNKLISLITFTLLGPDVYKYNNKGTGKTSGEKYVFPNHVYEIVKDMVWRREFRKHDRDLTVTNAVYNSYSIPKLMQQGAREKDPARVQKKRESALQHKRAKQE